MSGHVEHVWAYLAGALFGRSSLKYFAGYLKARLYEGTWQEYVWLKDESLPAETEMPTAIR